jgi:glyoxylase-like metal-dependent hydrolase (beta-lactamase superfamily II)
MTQVDLTLLAAGYCTQSEHILFRNGASRTIRFPALFALIRHPTQGAILFDTGYTARFFQETAHLPYRLYRLATPVYLQPEETAIRQVATYGVDAEDVRHIIISHFHADHICGLRDFPQARFFYFADALIAVQKLRGLYAVRAGFLPGLLPADFIARAQPLSQAQLHPLPPAFSPFEKGLDLFSDGSLVAVRLPGHAPGQMGLFVQSVEARYFLAADAVWHSRAYRENILPHGIVRLIFHDWRAYCTSFAQVCALHRLQPAVRIIPSHCAEISDQYAGIATPRVLPNEERTSASAYDQSNSNHSL